MDTPLETPPGDRPSLLESVMAHEPSVDATFWQEVLANKQEFKTAYITYCRDLPTHPRLVFYETMSGARMNDNPLAIFTYLLDHPEYQGFTHVWSVSNEEAIPREYRDTPNVVFVQRGTRAYAYMLARAKYIICNANLPLPFTRKPDQLYLSTWHGIPYKTLSRSTRGVVIPAGRAVVNFMKTTHVVSACHFMTERLLFSYSLTGAATALFRETGYPRVDLTVNMTPKRAAEVRSAAGLGSRRRFGRGRDRPVVLYAPTWRKAADGAFFDTERLAADLAALATLDVQVVFRGHYQTDKFVRDMSFKNVVIPPPELNSNELLAVVDVLITDYSSIFFDFLPTDRPVIHYLYDVAEYTKDRGLNLGVDELPGTVAYSRGELVAAVRAAVTDLAAWSGPGAGPVQGKRYAAAKDRFCPHEDGQSTRRAVEFFFHGRTDAATTVSPRDDRPSVAFWGGILTDSDASLDFVAHVARYAADGRWQVALVVERKTIKYRAARRAIAALDPKVAVLPRDVYKIGVTSAEAAARERVRAAGGTGDAEAEQLLKSMCLREYQRMLGATRFDRLILGPQLTKTERSIAGMALG